MIGTLIDHYRVLELVGRGAMGVVYKALDVNLDRLVAIKVMSAEVRSDPDFVERFRQEARLQGALNHPNIALLFDYCVHDGAPVAVMEWIVGESLEQMIRRCGPIAAHECIPIFKQALRGVAAAHRAGIIHRDLKPSNLMITRDDIVKVMDFGIAKRQGATGATKVSTSIGTSLYMAPEQILGRAVDCRTDVYALGVTLYELLSGQPPFNPRGKSEFMVLDAHVNDLPEPPTVHCRDIPQPLVNAVMRALAKEPDARFQSAEEFMSALPDVSAPDTIAPRIPPPTATVKLERPPQFDGASIAVGEPIKTVVIEKPQPPPRDAPTTILFDYPAPQPVQAGPPLRAAPPSPPAAAPAATTTPVGRLRLDRPAAVAALVAALVLGMWVHHAERQRMRPRPVPSLVAAAPPGRSPDANAAIDLPATAPPPATVWPARPDLSGTWRGEYIDAAGKQLLRVVGLSIRRVQDDGGIEGTLEYASAAGDGECKLRPRGSRYFAAEQRLRLSPEGCSQDYPKELGVPLDFDDVTPRANALNNGRIEAPAGATISVNLQRVSGL